MKAKLLQGFYLGDLFVEPLKGSVTGRGFSEHLSPDAVEVLLRLAHSPGSLVTRKVLLERVWGPAYRGEDEILRVALWRLRQKIEDDPGSPRYVLTRPGMGYLLAAPETL